MRTPLLALSLTALVLTGCGFGQSRLNPFNWFGDSREVSVATEEARPANPLIPRRNRILARPEVIYGGNPIDTVTELRVEPTLSGAIVQATGVAARQGAYDVRLTALEEDGVPVDGVLSFSFDVVFPNRPQPVGNVRSREVVVARSLTQADLEGVRVIRVIAARNAREVRRR